MKTKKFFLVIALVATVLPQILFAQTDSANTKIENRILSYENSDLFIVANARKMLVDKVKAGQKDTIREIYCYLHKKYANQKVLPFYVYEDVMISLYIGDYDKLLDS